MSMANASKNKGKSFERELAQHLTTVFGENCQRVPNSGAFTGGFNFHRAATMTAEQQLLAAGDLIVPKSLDLFTFECKWYKEIGWHKLMQGNEILVDSWISQARESIRGKRDGKGIWFLVFKVNRQGTFVVYDQQHLTTIFSEYAVRSCDCRCFYKGVAIESMDGFFEANKASMLTYNASNL